MNSEILLGKFVDHISTNSFPNDSVDYQLIVPDGMTELVINFGLGYSRIDRVRNREYLVKGSHVIGAKSSYCYVKPTKDMDVITIRFKTGALKNFSKIPQHLLVDNVVDAGEFFGKDVRNLENELFQSKDILVRKRLILDFLLSKMINQKDIPFDGILKETIFHVIKSHNKINSLFQGIHYKTLERMFLINMGYSPKKTLKILQFNFASYLLHQCNNLTQIAYDSGYYDQSHCIKSFYAYSGVSPKLFSKIDSNMFKFNQKRINAQFEYLMKGK